MGVLAPTLFKMDNSVFSCQFLSKCTMRKSVLITVDSRRPLVSITCQAEEGICPLDIIPLMD